MPQRSDGDQVGRGLPVVLRPRRPGLSRSRWPRGAGRRRRRQRLCPGGSCRPASCANPPTAASRGHVDEGRIADVRTAVRECQRGGIQVVVQRLLLGHRLGLRSPGCSAPHRPWCRRWRTGPSRRRRGRGSSTLVGSLLDRPCRRPGRALQEARRHRERRARGLRRVRPRSARSRRRSARGRRRRRPARPSRDRCRRGRGLRKMSRPGAHRHREEELAGAADRGEPGLVVQRLAAERRVDDEAAVGDPDGRLQRLAQTDRAPLVQRAAPRSPASRAPRRRRRWSPAAG